MSSFNNRLGARTGQMMSHVQDLAFRVGEFSLPEIPAADVTSVLGCLARHYGSASDPAALVPKNNEDEIRADIRKIVPAVAAVGDDIFHALQTNYSAVVINKANLDRFDVKTNSFLLLAMSLAMGTPTPTDKIMKRIVWDVKARKLPPGYVSTFSENDSEADLHTDTQYFPRPERFTLLYFVHAARCGGGVSMLRDVGCVKRQLATTPEGRWAIDFLSQQELPFRIPTTYTTTGRQGTLEATFATVLGDHPQIRYRTDTLEAGLQAFPEYDTPATRRALGALKSVLNDQSMMFREHLGDDSLLVTNNHVGLHGRTAFEDQERHVIRIRIADGSENAVKARVVLESDMPALAA
jgi:alpha-ketoglutarate-dependent taurine dioxygenase